eukprot:scaffold1637_cov410-Prasinococcus_capsulatus_cf.AAC.14
MLGDNNCPTFRSGHADKRSRMERLGKSCRVYTSDDKGLGRRGRSWKMGAFTTFPAGDQKVDDVYGVNGLSGRHSSSSTRRSMFL